MLKGGVDMNDKEQIDAIVGQNIQRAREKAGYTQERFSELVNIGPKSLSAIERGTVGISLSLLLRICKTLSVSTDSILLPPTKENNTDEISSRLRRLTPEQYRIAASVIMSLLEAFSLNEKHPSEPSE